MSHASLQFVASLSSPDATIRSQAETYLKDLLKTPEAFITTLVQAIQALDEAAPALLVSPANSPSSVFASHQMAFLLFRQKLMKWVYNYSEDNDSQVSQSEGPRRCSIQ